MKNKLLISVLIPTYNRSILLKRCLKSVLEQKGFNIGEIEIIISDNSEGDDTKMMINKNYTGSVLYNKNNTNLGMIGNWNKLLQMKKGKYFIFLSDDDLFYDNTSLLNLWDLLKKKSLDFVSGIKLINDEYLGYLFYDKKYYYKIFKGNNVFIYNNLNFGNNNIGFGGTLYKDVGILFNENIGLTADNYFNYEYLKKGYTLGLLNKFIFIYTIWQGRASIIFTAKYLKDSYIKTCNDNNLIPKKMIILKIYFSYYIASYIGVISRKLGVYSWFLFLYRKLKGQKIIQK